MHTMMHRRHRVLDGYQMFLLPGLLLAFTPYYHAALGFKLMTWTTLMGFYTRLRDKTADPEIEETQFRALLEEYPRINELFQVETMHVLDFDCEYMDMPCEEEFPEVKNKFFKFFNTDGNMTQGHYVFGDLETGATMRIDFQTMPVGGRYRFRLEEPFYFFDVKAQITHNGIVEDLVLVDREETLKKVRPHLMYM